MKDTFKTVITLVNKWLNAINTSGLSLDDETKFENLQAFVHKVLIIGCTDDNWADLQPEIEQRLDYYDRKDTYM